MPHSHPYNFLTARPGELPLSDHKGRGLALLLRHARCAQRDWGRFYRKSRKSGFHHTLYTRKTREILPKSTKTVPGPSKIEIKIIASRGTERWPLGRPLTTLDTPKPKNKPVKIRPVKIYQTEHLTSGCSTAFCVGDGPVLMPETASTAKTALGASLVGGGWVYKCPFFGMS